MSTTTACNAYCCKGVLIILAAVALGIVAYASLTSKAYRSLKEDLKMGSGATMIKVQAGITNVSEEIDAAKRSPAYDRYDLVQQEAIRASEDLLKAMKGFQNSLNELRKTIQDGQDQKVYGSVAAGLLGLAVLLAFISMFVQAGAGDNYKDGYKICDIILLVVGTLLAITGTVLAVSCTAGTCGKIISSRDQVVFRYSEVQESLRRLAPYMIVVSRDNGWSGSLYDDVSYEDLAPTAEISEDKCGMEYRTYLFSIGGVCSGVLAVLVFIVTVVVAAFVFPQQPDVRYKIQPGVYYVDNLYPNDYQQQQQPIMAGDP